jgi:hypothetical protein
MLGTVDINFIAFEDSYSNPTHQNADHILVIAAVLKGAVAGHGKVIAGH